MLIDEETSEGDFWDYAETVLADALTFDQICSDLFVVQGWDARSKAGTVSVPPTRL
jgi:hypothetical protein